MSSGKTAEDPTWESREQGEEARYAREKEREQLAALREQAAQANTKSEMDRDFEGGYGGQEDLEDRYATTSGEH